MELNEALLFVAAIVIMVFISIGIEKYLSPRSKLIVAIFTMLILVGKSISDLTEDFSYRRLITTSLLCIIFIYGIYRQYKKYEQDIQKANHSSSE